MIAKLQNDGRLISGCSLKMWRRVLLVTAFAALSLPCSAQDSPAIPPAPAAMDALARAPDRVQTYSDQFSNVACTESLTQIVLGKNGKPTYRENSVYDYQFQATSDSGAMKVTESRNTRSPAFRDPARTLLTTNGFASILLVVHPMYEASYTFEPAGEESIGGATLEKIRFTPVAGGASPAALRLRGRNYPLPLSGTLWIEPQTGVIVKLEAQVDSTYTAMRLSAIHSQVPFAPHTF